MLFYDAAATTEIYTLSLHDTLPISRRPRGGARGCSSSGTRRRSPGGRARRSASPRSAPRPRARRRARSRRSEEHTSELQSRQYLVCRLLLEKKKTESFALAIAHAPS